MRYLAASYRNVTYNIWFTWDYFVLDSVGFVVHRGPSARGRAGAVGHRQLRVVVRARRTGVGAVLRDQASDGRQLAR